MIACIFVVLLILPAACAPVILATRYSAHELKKMGVCPDEGR